jgi:hypothetical protein
LAYSESLTGRKSRKKETLGLLDQNRRMFPSMGSTLHTFSERILMTLAIALLVACAANVALVWVFL